MSRETVTPPRRDARGRRNRSNLTAKIAEIAERNGILSAFFAVMIPSVFCVRGRGTSTLRSAATEDGRRNAEQKNSRRISANLCSAIPRNRTFRARSWAKQFNRRGAKDAEKRLRLEISASIAPRRFSWLRVLVAPSPCASALNLPSPRSILWTRSTITPRFCPLGRRARGADVPDCFRRPINTMTERIEALERTAVNCK